MFYANVCVVLAEEGLAMGLSERQAKILSVIGDAVQRQGYPPTVREIGAAVGLCSPASVQSQLAALEQQGYIRRGSAKRRALELVGRASSGYLGRAARSSIPLVGRVAAGVPLLAEENVEDAIDVPGFLRDADPCFALKVVGHSMIKAGILDGDLVVVRQQEYADDGDIVVALLEDDATVKRFFRESEQVRLQPENDDMEPIFAREPVIAGKVVGVLRRL
jgi:repressor LexA